jgi:hypothetical protein
MFINRVEKSLYYEIDKDFEVLLISNYSEKSCESQFYDRSDHNLLSSNEMIQKLSLFIKINSGSRTELFISSSAQKFWKGLIYILNIAVFELIPLNNSMKNTGRDKLEFILLEQNIT